jgi:hypothetical protein
MIANERHTSTSFGSVLRRFFATSKHSERRPIGVDIQGRLGIGGEAKAVLEYGGEISG